MSYQIDELLTFYVTATDPSTGGVVDAASVPTYRIYKGETFILAGSMALLDDLNTVGFYSEQITLSVANGFDTFGDYTILISVTVSGVTGVIEKSFKIDQSVSDILDALLGDKVLDYSADTLTYLKRDGATTLKVFDAEESPVAAKSYTEVTGQ